MDKNFMLGGLLLLLFAIYPLLFKKKNRHAKSSNPQSELSKPLTQWIIRLKNCLPAKS